MAMDDLRSITVVRYTNVMATSLSLEQCRVVRIVMIKLNDRGPFHLHACN